jgi:hypothetical protein
MTTRSTLLAWLAGAGGLLALLALAAWLAYQRAGEEPPPPKEDDFKPTRLSGPEAPLSDVPVKPVGEAGDAVGPDELVIGLTVGGESRAYPIAMLNEAWARKVLNDRLGGRAVVVTWCDACHSAAAYDRTVMGAPRTFAVSGELWKNSLVMYDQETSTRWSQLTGEARQGPLRGVRLTRLPVLLTTWRAWRERYPGGTVALFDTKAPPTRLPFDDEPERFVLGLASGRRAKAWGIDALKREGAVNDEWDGRPVLAVLDPAAGAGAYERTVEGRTLTFAWQDGKLTDRETGSAWDAVTGKAVAGPLEGKQLAPLPATVATRVAWSKHHP